MRNLKGSLDSLYAAYNKRSYVHPDPLEFLYDYDAPADRETAGLIASCLAYGRVSHILASVARVLDPMGRHPQAYLKRARESEIKAACAGFVHRFTTGREMADLLISIKRAIERHGTLERLFAAGYGRGDETVLPALTWFVSELRSFSADGCPTLLPRPDKGSACKRLNLFLRWMARSDEVDPGPWESVSSSKLVVPLDTHMHRISRALGLTRRAQADARTALEVTRAFREMRPRDPVRYDFALTRLGIRKDCSYDPLSRLTRPA
jgi:uncharacterized protein (TIGR02757 family)